MSAVKKANKARPQKAVKAPKAPKAAKAPRAAGRGPSLGGFFRFLAQRWVRRTLLALVLAAVIFWQWNHITQGLWHGITNVYHTLGWGLILILLGIIVVLSIFFHEPLYAFAKQYKLNYWNRWLGAVAVFFALWGTFGLFGLGGSIGASLVAPNAFLGVLKVLGLYLLGLIFIAPGLSWRAVRGGVRRLNGQRPPLLQPLPADGVLAGPEATEQAIARVLGKKEKGKADKKLATLPGTLAEAAPAAEAGAKETARAEAGAPKERSSTEAKQVAQDVWKKYGQSASLVVVDGWKMPPIDILDKSQEIEYSEADNKQRAKIIEEALASYGVSGKVVQINVGPTVTQFGIEPGWDVKTKKVTEKDKDGNPVTREEEVSRTRVKVDRITSLGNDLALALSAPTIRIEAPVPGKPIVGVEVPNKIYGTVSLRGIIETNAFQKILGKSRLAMALGKGAGGEAVSDDLGKMPHLLIAGATGSGKTVCLNAVICCLLMDCTPFDTKFILIDPKRVELTQYNSIPHLAAPVIVDTDKALSAMRWLNTEMDNRYKKLAAAGARNIDGFNKGKAGADKMPYLVLVIDELADLMMAGFDEVEHILCRLAQLARAVGIHLVVATQRPSVDVITGLIKANFPTRISFAVTSQVDSRTVLDMVGAEKLLGRGDMLFAPTDAAKPKRLQGCYVSDAEVERLVYFWNSQKKEEATPIKLEDLVAMGDKKAGASEDPMMEQVRKLAKDHHQQLSASFLQRKLGIGYPRAARLFDQYKEEAGVNRDGGAEVPEEEGDEGSA